MADVISYVVRITDQSKAGMASATKGAKDFEKASDDATESAAGLSKGMGLAKASAVGLTASMGAAALGGAVVDLSRFFRDLAQEVADYRNDITDASTRSGAASDSLAGLRLAAEGSGLSFGALTSGLDQFGARIAQAAKGGNDTAKAFADLGVDLKSASGGLRDADDILQDTLARLNAMPASAERSALAFQALGRSGGKFLQALSGSELESFVDFAREFGVDVGPRAAASAGEWQRASAELDVVLRGLKGQIVDTFGGGADLLFTFTEGVVYSFEVAKGAVSGLANIADTATTAIMRPFEALMEGIEAASVAAKAFAAGDFSAALSAGRDFASAAGGFLEGGANIGAAVFNPVAAVSEVVAGGALEGASRGEERVALLRELRASILSGGGAGAGAGGGVGFGPLTGGGTSGGEAKFIRPGQTLDDTAAELDRALAAALGAQGGLDAAGQVILDSLDDVAKEARALINRDRITSGVGIGRSFLSGDVGGALGGVGDIVGGTAGARLGAAGAVVGGLQFIGEQGAEGIKETLNGVKDGLIGALQALPELIGDVLPQFAVSLVADLIPALIEASPDIFRALLLELPQAIGEAVAAAIGVESETGRGALRGASLGAAIGGVAAGVLTLGVGAGAGAAIGGTIGAGVGATLGRERDRSSNNARTAARTAETGRAQFVRTEDSAAMLSTRRRRSQPQQSPDNGFDWLARKYERENGPYGRFNSTVIREA